MEQLSRLKDGKIESLMKKIEEGFWCFILYLHLNTYLIHIIIQSLFIIAYLIDDFISKT